MALRFDKLTRPAIRSLDIGQRINEHGIVAERQASGDVRYSINVMVDGQRIHRVIGRESEGVTRKQAEDAIEALRTHAREDRLNLPTGRKLAQSFEDAGKAYIRLMEASGKNLKSKRRHVEGPLREYFGTMRLDGIKDNTVKNYTRKRIAAGFAQATVNRELATLSHMMRRASEEGWITDDARPKIAKGEEPRKKIVVLSEAQSAELMKAAVSDQDARLWLFVAFGLNTAMRHSEILRVRYDAIDFDSRRIFIEKAKAGEREQPITQTLADMLKKQQKAEGGATGWIFPAINARSKEPHRLSMGKQFLRAVERAKLDPRKVTPHVMRHTAITRLVRAGVDLPTIQKISGHKTLLMVMRYVHIHGAHIDTAISALDTGFSDTVTPELHTPPIEQEEGDAAILPFNRVQTAA